jgi:hypothetical protein
MLDKNFGRNKVEAMKSIALSFLLLGSLYCFAGDTNIIAMSDWSEPVALMNQIGHDQVIRGRLLIVAGSSSDYGGSEPNNQTMMFVELQNLQGSVKLYFDVMGLKCNLIDSNGNPAPEPNGKGWGGGGPVIPSWLVLPGNSTIRLIVNGGRKSPLTICKGGEPWDYWSIPSSDTNVYFLSGTLTIAKPTNSTLTVTPPGDYHQYADWSGKLIFPKIEISANKM